MPGGFATTEEYARLRRARIGRIKRLRKMKAPAIIVLGEQLLLLQARLFKYHPQRIADGTFQQYGRRRRAELWRKEGSPRQADPEDFR
jgi:hypothetical protein